MKKEKRKVAIECSGDAVVVSFLAEDCGLPLRTSHHFGQGPVVDAVLVRGTATLGIVDEDPGKSHHPARDDTTVQEEMEDVVWRRKRDQHLFIIKPDLEGCFIRSSRRLHRTPKDLPGRAADLQRLLNRPGSSTAHSAFRRELAALREEGMRRGVATFVTDLERMVRAV